MTKNPLFTNPKINFLILIDITFIVYLAVIVSGFSSLDDTALMEVLQKGKLTVSSLVASGGTYLRPLTVLTYLLDYQLWGDNAAAFHFSNLIIHIANACLTYFLCRSYLPDTNNREGTSFLAALFFAVSPLNSESVLWVSGRTDLLCGFFFIAALLVLLNDRLPLLLASGGFFTLYFCSLLAKESSIALLGIVPLYLFFTANSRSRREKISLCCSAFLASGIYLLMRFDSKGQLDSGATKIIAKINDQSFSDLIYKSTAAVGFYIKKLIWPYPLNLAIERINEPVYFLVGILAVIAIIAFIFRFTAARLPLFVITLCLAPPLLAFNGSIPWTLYAERYLYLSMVGMALLIGLLIATSPRLPQALPFFLIIPFAVSTIHRSGQWAVPVVLWKDTVSKAPQFPQALVIYAYELIQVGQIAEAEASINKARSFKFENELLLKCMDSINQIKSSKSSHLKKDIPL